MEEKNNILSKFESFKNNEPYKVPEDYFNTLLSRIQDKVEVGEKKKIPAWRLSYKPLIKLGFLVAGIAFIAFISFEVLKPVWNSSHTQNNQIDDIASYIDNQVFTLDDVTLLSVTESNKNEIKSKVNEQNDTINFLLNNNVCIEDIINEL